ncbi:MAG TPA: peptide deformylase [candidate division Zixibacteria bacterium]|nr:peptide deformylase [candidate division Zixibacteria bacterium]
MAVCEILRLGNPKLHQKSEDVEKSELDDIKRVIDDLHDTIIDFRARHNFGRAIAAPQIGVFKRVIYMHIGTSIPIINPRLLDMSDEMIEVWDNCMSFPDLVVKVRRHAGGKIIYRDQDWNQQSLVLGGDLAELLQHECDHLDGILATQRAIDNRSFALKSEMDKLERST